MDKTLRVALISTSLKNSSFIELCQWLVQCRDSAEQELLVKDSNLEVEM
jgi:hypothetical protein